MYYMYYLTLNILVQDQKYYISWLYKTTCILQCGGSRTFWCVSVYPTFYADVFLARDISVLGMKRGRQPDSGDHPGGGGGREGNQRKGRSASTSWTWEGGRRRLQRLCPCLNHPGHFTSCLIISVVLVCEPQARLCPSCGQESHPYCLTDRSKLM